MIEDVQNQNLEVINSEKLIISPKREAEKPSSKNLNERKEKIESNKISNMIMELGEKAVKPSGKVNFGVELKNETFSDTLSSKSNDNTGRNLLNVEKPKPKIP